MFTAAYDKDGIWGVGTTEDQAREEAAGFLKEGVKPEDFDAAMSGLQFAPISDELIMEATGGATGDITLPQSDWPHKLDENGVLVLDRDRMPQDPNVPQD